MFIEQDYGSYTDEQHLVWAKLYERRMPSLREQACSAFLHGVDAIGLDPNRLPNIQDINTRLQPLTGWQSRPVPGYLPAMDFFSCLAARNFPTTIGIRTMEQLDYLPEPDIFHDIFGHVPLHANSEFANFLQYYGQVAAGPGPIVIDGRRGSDSFHEWNDRCLTELARLFWFTVEFGLIRENGKIKLFGSGLMSSIGEGAHCLTDAVEKRKFDLWEVVNTDFEIDHFQPVLYVIESFSQLVEALEEWEHS